MHLILMQMSTGGELVGHLQQLFQIQPVTDVMFIHERCLELIYSELLVWHVASVFHTCICSPLAFYIQGKQEQLRHKFI